ncbi:MAG: hypothetical protein R3182_12065, partial [Draconibacterium sp.]|nr:hypothetical protein [Draconibacterium sp.]
MEGNRLKKDLLIECGAETWEGDRFLDLSGNYKLSNAKGRTTEEKRNGEYSVKLVKESPYGMSIDIDSIQPDDYFFVTVWKKGYGHLCASDDDPEGFFRSTNQVVETDSLGWEKLVLELYIPPDYKMNYLKILLCNFGTEPVYFDDLKLFKTSKREYPVFDEMDVMNIFIDDESLKKLKEKRQEALNEGLLITEDDDWVKAMIFYQNDVLDTRIRLKGDRLDHLEGRKWSFRIKVRGEKSWKGMKTFSVQTPAARYMLHEWLFHKALDKEDILSTRYGFVPVAVNGESLGIYAWEEHFEKQLVEAKKRREGPIMKLSDDDYWLYDKLWSRAKLNYEVPSYDASVITPFDRQSTVSDTLL